jgi:hypothetical protein
MVEQIEIDGEGWDIREEDTIWIAHGTEARNRGCIISAHNRDALIKHIPEASEKHRMASIALGMEHAIVRAFADVITSNQRDGYKKASDYAERQEKFARLKELCTELWPWVFEKAKS